LFCGVDVDVEASAAVVDEEDAVVSGVFVELGCFYEVLDAVCEVECECFVEVLWVLWDRLVVDGCGGLKVCVEFGDGVCWGEICFCKCGE